MDCEDAVAVSRKADARNSVVKLLSTLDFGKADVAVRINALSTGKKEEVGWNAMDFILCAIFTPNQSLPTMT